jgi:hypothetical protein
MVNLQNPSSDRLFSLLNELAEASVKCVICGGVACVLHGVERSTYDLDIAVDFSKKNLQKIIDVAKKFNLIPRIPEPIESLLDDGKRKSWIEKKGALVYTLVSQDSPMQIDIFLDYPIDFDELFHNSKKIKIESFEVLISSKEDLIFAKKNIEPVRDKDLIDIKELENLIRNEKDNK